MTHERLPREQFVEMRTEAAKADDTREELIKQSRGLLKNAKKTIQLVHQGRLEEAQETMQIIDEEHKNIKQKNNAITLQTVGAYSEALEEYVEAACMIAYAREDTIPTKEALGAPLEQYLGGLSDLTGELLRTALIAAGKRETGRVEDIRTFIDALYTEMIEFHLRNGHLRKKVDTVRHNLMRVEELLYEQRLREKTLNKTE